MFNTATLFTLSDEIIYHIDVHLKVMHNPTQESQNSNDIQCKSEIHHNSPYFAITTIPVIYDENIVQEQLIIKCNKAVAIHSLKNSVILAKFPPLDDNLEIKLLSRINPTKNDLDEDINMILKLILSKTNFSKVICERYRGMAKFSLSGNTDLEFKYLLFTFKNNGSLYEPSYYFNYTMKLLEFIRREHNVRKTELFPFLRKFILVVLNYFRSDGLFGPHTALSFYLYHHYKIHIRCLPFDLTFDDKYHNSEEFYYMNFSLIENTISLTSQLALIWGYQSKCHNIFMDCVKNLNIKSQYGESLRIMELRLRESAGASEEDFKNFTAFSREFFPNLIGAHPLSNQLLDYPISLSFIHELMRLSPLVAFPKDTKEVVKFSLPSSTLANVVLSEYTEYPDNARYDFSNPQVTKHRTDIQEYFDQKKLEEYTKDQGENDIHQLNEPIVTSFYGLTSLYITQYTNQFDFSKIDLHDLMYISVSNKNPYYVLEKGILYKGYNFNTGKMKGRDQNPCTLVLAARDILSVEIPKSVTIISESAFANCRSLNKVTFEKNSLLKIIEDRAFFECKNLQEINFKDTELLKEIGDNAFQYSGIKQIQFSENSELTRIGEFAFSSCENLYKVEIPIKTNFVRQNGPELSIKSFAFYKSSVKELKISSVGSIYDYAFADTKLEEVQLPIDLNYIGSYVFANCNLKKITIPRNINYIPSGIFPRKDITIEIAKEIPQIIRCQKNDDDDNKKGPYKEYKHNEGELPIFFHQHQLQKFFENSISPPRLFSNIIKKDQQKDDGLNDGIFPSKKDKSEISRDQIVFISPDHDFEKDKLPSRAKHILEGAFMRSTISVFDSSLFKSNNNNNNNNNKPAKEVKKTIDIKRIHRMAFAYMINLRIVDLKDMTYIQNIPDFCFFHSSQLTKVRLPNSIRSIGRYSFAYTNLREINLYQLTNLKEIKDYAFYDTRIQRFYVPSSVKYLGSHFYSVSFYKIKNDVANEQEEEADDEYDDEELSDDDDEEKKVNEEEEEDEAEDDVEEQIDISQFNFSKNDNYNKDEERVKSKECKIIFLKPSKLTRIECHAFYQSSIQTINLPSSVKYIGSYAFARTMTDTIYIPKNVRRIPDGAFYLSVKLRKTIFEDLNNINYIGSYSYTATTLLDFDVPPNISFISDQCFYNTRIEGFHFDNAHKIHEIKHQAFNNEYLNIKLPITVSEIEENSFVNDAKYSIVDFVGGKTKQIINELKMERADKFPDFDDYDEIVFLPDNTIDFKREENQIYTCKHEVEPKDEKNKEFANLLDCIEMIAKDDNKSKYFNFRSVSTSNKILTDISNSLLKTKAQCNATILPYYEIASKQVTHISLSYIDDAFLSINSILIEIDMFTKDIQAVLHQVLSHFNLSFINEDDIDIVNDFFGFNLKSFYSPNNLSQETYSLCKELNLNISKKPSLFPVDDQELQRLTSLTTISCIYIDIKEFPDKKFQFVFKNKDNNLIQLRPITKDDYFEMYLYYDKNDNKIITKQFLTNLEEEDIKWLNGYIYLNADPIKEDEKISLTYGFSLDHLIRDVLDLISRGNLKAGQKPYDNFMKIKCIFAYIHIFKECAEEEYSLFDISSRTLFLNESLLPLFVFVPPKDESSQYSIDLELKRFWLLIYELLTNQNIDDLMNKVEKNEKSISFEKLKFRKEFNEMPVFNEDQIRNLRDFFNKFVFQICFDFDKFDSKGELTNKQGAFDFIFQKFTTLWNNLFIGVKIDDEQLKNEMAKVELYIREIISFKKEKKKEKKKSRK